MDSAVHSEAFPFAAHQTPSRQPPLPSRLLSASDAVGCSIAIKGPMGTGKTTLIKYGISQILNRPFSLIALGGCSDSGYLDGHDYTYEGSKYGKILDILIQCNSMNPVILFDELDMS